MAAFPRIARFRSAAALREHLHGCGAPIPFDDEALSAERGSPLAAPLAIGDRVAGNRFCIHPMEGWDASETGLPTEILLRRWRRFGESGAKIVWGGEAVAVVAEGRANPRQLLAPALGRDGLRLLLDTLRSAHRATHGDDGDLVVALQLTHSGRFSQPVHGPRRPRVAFHHPLLDARHGVPADTDCVVTDGEIGSLVAAYGSVNINYQGNLTAATIIQPRVEKNQATIILGKNNLATTTNMTDADFTNTSVIYGSFSYSI